MRPPRESPGASASVNACIDHVHLLTGDAYQVLTTLPNESVDCVVTSPPYWGMRDYGVRGQYGLEPNVEDYITNLQRVFTQIRRVLVPSGTVWLNLADRYSTTAITGRKDAIRPRDNGSLRYPSLAGHPSRALALDYPVPAKNLIGLPWRVALALQADGWWLRNAIVWHKPNAMPESVRDRLSCRYELIFLLTRQARYYFDLDAIRQPLKHPEALTRGLIFGGANKKDHGCLGASARRRGHNVYGLPKHTQPSARGPGHAPQTVNHAPGGHAAAHPQGRNPGDVWTLSTRPFPGAHFATFPIDLPLRAIAAGCPPGGTVLDPFSGAGTTIVAAHQLRRAAIGIDINSAHHQLTYERLLHQQPADTPFGDRSGEPDS